MIFNLKNEEGEERVYIPEFNEIIETKSQYFVEKDEVEKKRKAVLEEGYSFELLTTIEEIEDFEV